MTVFIRDIQMKKLFLLLLGLTTIGCVTPSTLLVNREGKVMRCASTGYGYGIAGAIAMSTAEATHSRCVSDMKRLGFIELPNVSIGVYWQQGILPPTVASIKSNSPAEKAGIKVADQIIAIDGQPTPDFFTALAAVQSKRPGDQVKMKLNRGGEIVEIPLQLSDRDESAVLASTSSIAQPSLPPPPVSSPPAITQTQSKTAPAAAALPLPQPEVKATRYATSISLINRVGSTVSCPPESPDSWGLNSCVGNAESQGFVKVPDISAGIILDWNSKPVRIIQVAGAASEAGVRAGDILLELDGNKIVEPIAIFKIVGKKQPGDYIIVNIVRGGKPMNFTYRLTAR
jgi:membrane-associated protease RseP (regulator of RpoE activity)